MINPKSFIEFCEKELKVEFIDITTGRRVLDLIAEEDNKKKHPYRNPLYKSDYDLFLEEGDREECRRCLHYINTANSP